MIKNLDKIHKIKWSKIEKIFQHINKHNNNGIIIQKVIIFGSAATIECDEDSDIDICLFPAVKITDHRFF